MEETRQTLIKALSDEPVEVLYIAYVYAKNFVAYGEDVTKTWDTATKQSAILEKVRRYAYAQAYEDFKNKEESEG